MNTAIQTQKLKQPPVFKLAYFTTICERFGFYVLTYLLVLFLKGEYKLSDNESFILFGTFTALAFLTPAIGGYLADNFFGIRRSIIWGLLFEGTGLVLLAIPLKVIFPLSLALIIIGVGLFKTGPTDLLAHSYEENDPRIDSGFTFYYMAINIGSLFSSLVAGYIQEYFGWHVAFLFAGIILYLGLVFYFIFRKTAITADSQAGKKSLPLKTLFWLVVGLSLSTLACYFLVSHAFVANVFFAITTIITFGYFIFEIIRSPHKEKISIAVCLYLIFIGFACSVFYFQMFTSLELFINRLVGHKVLGVTVPTVILLGLNPVFNILLGPIFAWLYIWLGKHNRDISVVTKLSLGLLLTVLSFFIPVIGIGCLKGSCQVGISWMVLTFFVFTAGELLNSALGVAMVTHIAPKRLYGVMMGTWFLVGNALAASVSGVFANIVQVPQEVIDPTVQLGIYSKGFIQMGLIGVAVSVVIFLINPFIQKVVNSGLKNEN